MVYSSSLSIHSTAHLSEPRTQEKHRICSLKCQQKDGYNVTLLDGAFQLKNLPEAQEMFADDIISRTQEESARSVMSNKGIANKSPKRKVHQMSCFSQRTPSCFSLSIAQPKQIQSPPCPDKIRLFLQPLLLIAYGTAEPYHGHDSR